MVMRVPLRATAVAAAEDLVIAVQRHGDPALIDLARRNLTLVETQYAGIEMCLDALNYAEPTKATLRRERDVLRLHADERRTSDADTSNVAD